MLVLRSLVFNTLFYANLVLWLLIAVLPAMLLPKRALLVYETESEANVFRALATSAAALEEVRKQFPGAIDAFELLCETSSGSLGARFTLTPAQAADIMAGRVDITRFFFENVEF